MQSNPRLAHCRVLLRCGTQVLFACSRQQRLGGMKESWRRRRLRPVSSFLYIWSPLARGGQPRKCNTRSARSFSLSLFPSVYISYVPSVCVCSAVASSTPFCFHGNLALPIQLWRGDNINNYCSLSGGLHLCNMYTGNENSKATVTDKLTDLLGRFYEQQRQSKLSSFPWLCKQDGYAVPN